jgi:hypothetical protein
LQSDQKLASIIKYLWNISVLVTSTNICHFTDKCFWLEQNLSFITIYEHSRLLVESCFVFVVCMSSSCVFVCPMLPVSLRCPFQVIILLWCLVIFTDITKFISTVMGLNNKLFLENILYFSDSIKIDKYSCLDWKIWWEINHLFITVKCFTKPSFCQL